MRGGYAEVGLFLVGTGFGIFAWKLAQFGVRTAPLFVIATAAALTAALAVRLRRTTLASVTLAIVAITFLGLQFTRPTFSLTLGTIGNLLVAAGAATAAYGLLRRPETNVAARGMLIAAAGGVAFLPGNFEAGGSFLLAGLLATLGFAIAGAPSLMSVRTSQDATAE